MPRRSNNSSRPEKKDKKLEVPQIGQNVPPVPGDLFDPQLTPTGEYVAQNNYLKRDETGKVIETPKEMFWRVAHNVASADLFYKDGKGKMSETRDQFYRMLANLEFVPNTPTLANAANKLQQLSACFVLPVEDNLDDIGKVFWQTMKIHKTGGGTGFSFSRLRPYGSIVRSTGRTSSGAVYFMWMYADATDRIQQGGYRRGANMGVMRVDHPDILRWITVKSAESVVSSFNLSVAITDNFMKKVEEDSRFAPNGLKDCEEELNKIIEEIQMVLKNSDLTFGDRVRAFEEEIKRLKVLIEAKEQEEGYALINPDTKEIEGKLNARKMFELIARLAWEKGDPGVIFIDRINKDNATPQIGEIEATNPCVVGSTLVATEHGLMSIEKIVKEKIEMRILTDNRVVGGEGVTLRPHNHLWDNGVKEVWKLETESGFTLEATPDHKIRTERGWVQLEDLKVGEDKVLIQSGKGTFSRNSRLPFDLSESVKKGNPESLPERWSLELGQVLGWLVGDGWLRDGDKNCRVGFTFARSAKKILDYFQPTLNRWYGCPIKPVKRANGVWHLSYHGQKFVEFFVKFGVKPVKAGQKEVPPSLFCATEDAVIGFLQGLFSADGTIGITQANGSKYIRLTAKSKKLLQQVQILLANLEIFSRIYDRSRPARKIFPYTSKRGDERLYSVDGVCFELNISRTSVGLFLQRVGFLCGKHKKKVDQLKSMGYYPQTFSDTVASMVYKGKENVYDLTEQQTSSFIANCMVISNCGEQPLLPYESCNLGAVNLSRMVKKPLGGEAEIDYEKLGQTVRLAVHFLDNVIDMNQYPLAEIENMTKSNRKVGLGIMGWAGLLVQLGIPYNSPEACHLAGEVMQFIRQEARQESLTLAKERGVFPNFKGSIFDPESSHFKGEALFLRNAALTTIAPTGTTSMLADVNSGIEPFFALYYKKNIVNGDQVETLNPYFVQVAKQEGFWSDDLVEKVKNNKGSLKGIEEVPERIQRLFPVAADISPEDHILVQAAFQKNGVDNAISKTINLPNKATVEDVIHSYRLAYETGCKGVTIYRDQSRKKQILVTESRTLNGVSKAPAVGDEALKPRPVKVEGATYKIETPLGNAFITINHDANGNPFEVFVTIGKAGSEVAAMAEGLGRMISTTLRFGGHLPPLERVKEIIEQLQGIGGSRSVGFGTNKIRSLPDAIAKALGMHFGLIGYPGVTPVELPRLNGETKNTVVEEMKLEMPMPLPTTEMQAEGSEVNQISLFARQKDFCPGCGGASLVFEEGCKKCHTCGYSEC